MTFLVLNGDIMVRKGVFWTIGEHLYFVCYPNMAETMDMGRYLWKNGVSRNIPLTSMCQ